MNCLLKLIHLKLLMSGTCTIDALFAITLELYVNGEYGYHTFDGITKSNAFAALK